MLFARTVGKPIEFGHAYGKAAQKAIETRRTGGGTHRRQPDEIVFTGGGSEASNQAIKGIACADYPSRRALSQRPWSIPRHQNLSSIFATRGDARCCPWTGSAWSIPTT